MSVEKKLFPVFKLYAPEDLSKEWFFSYINEGKRCKVKGGINRFHTFGSRMIAAEALLEELKRTVKLKQPLPVQMVDWIEHKRGSMRLKGYRTYRSKIDVFLRWLGPRKVTNQNLQLFFSELLVTRHNTTYLCFRQTFRQMFKALGKPELMDGIGRVRTVKTPANWGNYRAEAVPHPLL